MIINDEKQLPYDVSEETPTPFDEGYTAYWEDRPGHANPYMPGTELFEQWYKGWNAACTESTIVMTRRKSMIEEKTVLDLWNERKGKAYKSANVEWFAEKLAKYAETLENLLVDAETESDMFELYTEQLKGNIKFYKSCLIAEGHDPECPVVAAASVDCVPGGGCIGQSQR